ncbi:MAG: zinc ribbon domain-containing protein [Nitrospirae bacterium]|uniref:FmdB family zinc ribbon protein n=1 Tax=Candidatus Magnetobacterium casense TaxID=1455061 RepID=UPI000591556D|nr:zinc ribbon domain-containing protein [Candidatus Magnetobacterium casensis]MBF0337141.1 zinc ribbon domain-containing protein [Nitrospirota bacterium]
MPIYEFECTTCKRTQEMLQKVNDTPVSVCPECGGQMRKLISPTSFVLKGEGWYVTDYPSKDRKNAVESEKSEGKPTETTDKTTGESKPAPESKTVSQPQGTAVDK